MNCVVPGRGIRAFGKAIQCLAKIGEELYIEALRKGLTLKTVNSARSAFASFLFCRSFFSSYSDGRGSEEGRGGREEGEDGDEEEGEERSEDIVKCRITIKSCLTVFRALSSLEKTVDYFNLSLNLKLSKLVFVFHCRHGIVRTHSLGFQECEALQAVFTKELCPNHIKVQTRTLGEVVLNFPSFVEEVTMTADPESVRLKNYSEDEGTRSTLTEVVLLPAEFDDYQIGVDVAITFCLKELRAVMLFTDAFPHALSVQFESAGRPVVFSIDDNTDFKADFVLATLLDPNMPPATTSAPHLRPPSTSTAHTVTGRQRQTGSVQDRVVQNGRGGRHRRRVANDEGLTRRDGDNESVDEWCNPFERQERTEEGESQPTQSGSRTTRIKSPTSHSLETTSGRGSRSVRTDSHCDLRDGGVRSDGGDGVRSDCGGGVRSDCGDGVRSDGGDGVRSDGGDGVRIGDDGYRVLSRGDGGDVMEGGGGVRGGGVPGGSGVRDGGVPGGGGAMTDPLNALFGEENMADVGEEGEEGWDVRGFGMNLQPAPTTTTTIDLSVRHSFRGPQSDAAPAPLTDTSHHSPHPHSPHSPPSPVREDGWEMGRDTTQDSILQDSGFLPGTPPAKKPKTASSLLFGVGLFTSDLSTHQQSLILAPDSEGESD